MVANDPRVQMQVQIPLQAQYFPNQQYFLPQQQYVQYHSPSLRPKITKIPVIAGGRKKTFSKRSKTGCLTCRTRRIKCDEGHSTCKQCLKSKRICMYPDNSKSMKDDGEDDEIAREKNRKNSCKDINRSVEMFTVEIPNITRQSTDSSLQYSRSESYPSPTSTSTSMSRSSYNTSGKSPQLANTDAPYFEKHEHMLSPVLISQSPQQSPQQLPYLIYQSPTTESSLAAPIPSRQNNVNITEQTACQNSCCHNNLSRYRLASPEIYYSSQAASAPIPQRKIQFTQNQHHAYSIQNPQTNYPCYR
jgi:hypothetical protein